jgi:hypothetical protein
MLAVKIFQGDPDDLNSALIGHVENNESSCGLEVALYQGIALPSEQIERIAALPSNNKILHTYHRVIGLTELEREDPSSLTRLLAESDVAKAMGISKAVVHSVTFADKRKGFPLARQTASSWVKNLERMHSLGLRAHLENTTEPLSWHQELFDEWDKLGVQEMGGFTLDIGHVKVWSDNALNQWLDFTKQLKSRGFGIHFHIHSNHGEFDEHMSLSRAFQEDLLEPSEEWAPKGLIPWLLKAIQEHPESLFTLENPAHEAIENWVFTRFMLSAETLTHF